MGKLIAIAADNVGRLVFYSLAKSGNTCSSMTDMHA